MCKFTNKLFAISVLLLISAHSSCGTPLKFLFDYIDDGSGYDDVSRGDYDLRYDQRQNGTENVRLNIDGVVIAVPAPSSSSSSSSSSFSNVATNYLLQTLLGSDYDEKNADISAEESSSDTKQKEPIQAEEGPSDTKQNEPIQAEKDNEKKPENLKDVSVDEKKGDAEVVLLRNNAKVSTVVDEVHEPKKAHLRNRNK